MQELGRGAAKLATTTGRDLTRYAITTPNRTTGPLPKRRAIHALVVALHDAGVTGELVKTALPRPKLLCVDGSLDGEELIEAFIAAHPVAERNQQPWFVDSPLQDSGKTWVLSKMWGLDTEDALNSLADLAPAPGYSFAPT